jgi:hypothetical protein
VQLSVESVWLGFKSHQKPSQQETLAAVSKWVGWLDMHGFSTEITLRAGQGVALASVPSVQPFNCSFHLNF